jgi:hypothetical protein
VSAALAPATVADLWAHAQALAEQAERELSPPAVRRALVVLAVAGSGGDPAAFERLVSDLEGRVRRLALDPVPLFDAAAALVADEDVAAREALVTVPRRTPVGRRPR